MFVVISQGEGYDCETNEFGGDGSWSNVVAQREWVLGHIAGSITGSLRKHQKKKMILTLFTLFIEKSRWMSSLKALFSNHCCRRDILGGKPETRQPRWGNCEGERLSRRPPHLWWWVESRRRDSSMQVRASYMFSPSSDLLKEYHYRQDAWVCRGVPRKGLRVRSGRDMGWVQADRHVLQGRRGKPWRLSLQVEVYGENKCQIKCLPIVRLGPWEVTFVVDFIPG